MKKNPKKKSLKKKKILKFFYTTKANNLKTGQRGVPRICNKKL